MKAKAFQECLTLQGLQVCQECSFCEYPFYNYILIQMAVMELDEVYGEAKEEKMCMLQSTFDNVWYKIRDHVSEKVLDKAFVGLVKKLAELGDADKMLEWLLDTEAKIKKLKAEKLAEKPEEKEEGMDFITIVMQGYGTEPGENSEEEQVTEEVI